MLEHYVRHRQRTSATRTIEAVRIVLRRVVIFGKEKPAVSGLYAFLLSWDF